VAEDLNQRSFFRKDRQEEEKERKRERQLTLAQTRHQHPLHILLLGRHQLQRQSLGSSTSRTSRTMDVSIGGAGELEVHDVRDGGDVESTGGDVGGEEDGVGGRFEAVEEGRGWVKGGGKEGKSAQARSDRLYQRFKLDEREGEEKGKVTYRSSAFKRCLCCMPE
jgi:hypothetical protein